MTQSLEKINSKEKYITLKEAALLSGYSSDYVGQLIREGKIAGKQVYYNIAWVTTRDEISRYLHLKEKGANPSEIRGLFLRFKHSISNWLFTLQPVVLFKSFLYAVVILLAVFSALLISANLKQNQIIKTNSSADTYRVIEYEKDSKKIINTTDLPYVP
jgi:hypothetical protein